MRHRILTGILLISSLSVSAQTWQDTASAIEKIMSIYSPENPGCQLSIQRGKQMLFSKAYGMADLEHGAAMTLHSKTEAGSVSKQFTAAAILLLEQQGKLALDDDIRKYVPELMDYGHVITIEHLMHHTSGLKDWGSVAALSGWGRTTKAFTNDDALEIILAQKTLNNVPGAEFIYSNSNYNLMAIIVQRLSGKSLAEFTKEQIFLPAGMLHTEWRDNYKRIVKDRAMSYELTKSGYQTLMPNEDAYGNGGLLTTTEDLLKWNAFYLSGKLGISNLLKKQLQVQAFNNGIMNDYAAGLFIQEYRGKSLYQHSGATAAYRANLDYFPDLDLSIAILSNTSQFDTSRLRLAQAMRNIFIAEETQRESEEPIKRPVIERFHPEILTGWYQNSRDGSGVLVSQRADSLFLNGRLISPISQHLFKLSNATSQLQFAEKGKEMWMITPRDTILYTHAKSPEVNQTYLEKYVGNYRSDESNSNLKVYMNGDKLMLWMKPNEETELIPTYEGGFELASWGASLYFVSEKNWHLKISTSRARKVDFEKTE